MADDEQDFKGPLNPSTSDGLDHARRRLLIRGLWVAPAIIGTATVKARAQSQSCNPFCPPVID